MPMLTEAMFTEPTKEVLQIYAYAQDKKRTVEHNVAGLRKRIDHDKDELLLEEVRTPKVIADEDKDTMHHLRKVAAKAKTVMEEKKIMSKMKEKLRDAEDKLAQIRRWSNKTEYGDEGTQFRAINKAAQTYRSI
jgi:hypothetical protein